MEFWQNIYAQFDPVAFNLGSIAVHWYGIMYAAALLSAIFVAKWIIKKDKLPIKSELFDSYIWWAEIGVILGARIGYVLFYDTHTMYYLTHPWQIFNPYINGVYAGISGMSYHGAFIGFIIASYLFCRRNKVSFWFLADIAVLGISAGYVLGRIGNFVNQELVGRVSDVAWAINVNGVLRHPSQIYEAILEGVLVFSFFIIIEQEKALMGNWLLCMGFYTLLCVSLQNFSENLIYNWDLYTATG